MSTIASSSEPVVPTVNRIVIGDVGSGKTLVAFVLALTYLHGLSVSGQAALLAPTEVLAFQHYKALQNLLQSAPIDFTWLDTVFLTSKNVYLNNQKISKKQLRKHLEQNTKKIFWIGTQALLFTPEIQPDLVMVDEQHRFGVSQRQKLANSSGLYSPHFVSFTATPIPRTLALTFLRSLKPVFLQRIAGRQEIATTIVDFEAFDGQIVPAIQQHLAKQRKVYVICPKIQDLEGEEIAELWSVAKAAKTLEQFFPNQIMTVHGKVSQKKDILSEFKESPSKHILVATTVIEVGVDVPQASLVIILNAERFGLAALHQIRGRVGRNNFADNQCILVTHPQYRRSKRLLYLCQHQDGFVLAEKDLELRGSGDILGKLQSGFGDEIDKLMGLNPQLYYQISQVVDQIDLHNLHLVPRLEKYLQTKFAEVWKE